MVSPTPTDVLVEEEEEEEEAKKTEEEKGKEKDTETAEAEGGRKGAEAGGGGAAKQPEGVTTRSRSTTKRRLRDTGAAEAKLPEGVTTRGQKRRATDTGAGEEVGQRAVVERPHFVMGKHLHIVESTIGEGRGVKTKVDIAADTCLGEYKGERIEGTAPDCLTGRGDKVLCIKGGGADSKTGRGVWVDGGKRGNIFSRINARPRQEDCDVIIHLDDGTPRVWTRRDVKAGTELAMFYGVNYPLPPSPPPADAADPDEPAAEGSNQPVLTTQNILPSASALPAGQLYADDGSLVGRQYFSLKVTYPSQATVTHVDGGQFIVRKGDRVRLLWSEMGGPNLTQVESRTCCFKMDWRTGRFVRPLTTVWGDHNSLGGDFITAGSRLAGVYPPWFCYEFEGAAPGGVVEMVFVGGKWEVISVQNRKDVYGQTGQWLQVGIDLRGYDAEYQAAARGIRPKTFFVRAERAMGVDSRWGATLDWAEWRAEHLVAPPGKKTIKTQDKSVYERVKDRVYGHVLCRVDGHAIKQVDGGGGTGGGMGHCISVIAECSKDSRGKSSWFLLVWEAGGLDSPRFRRICQVGVDRALAKMPDLQSRIEHWGKSSTVSPPCGVEPDEPKAKRARVDGGPYRCTFATANFFKEFIRRGSLPVQGAGLRQQFDVRDPSFCWTTLSKFVVWGGKWQMKRSVPVQKAKAEVEEMLSKGNPTQWLLPPEKGRPLSPPRSGRLRPVHPPFHLLSARLQGPPQQF